MQVNLNDPRQMMNLAIGKQQQIEQLLDTYRSKPEAERTDDPIALSLLESNALILLLLGAVFCARVEADKPGIVMPHGFPRKIN